MCIHPATQIQADATFISDSQIINQLKFSCMRGWSDELPARLHGD